MSERDDRPGKAAGHQAPSSSQAHTDILAMLNKDAASEAPERGATLVAFYAQFVENEVDWEDSALHIIYRVGERWTAFILSILKCGTFRHSELLRIINFFSSNIDAPAISQRILTQKLRVLERDGLLMRIVWPTVPPRTDYSLTPLGKQLADMMDALVEWCLRHKPEIEDAQQAFDARQ